MATLHPRRFLSRSAVLALGGLVLATSLAAQELPGGYGIVIPLILLAIGGWIVFAWWRRRSADQRTAEERDKLFLPYYSTKGRGSGLGLAIVRRIVAEHGGSVDVADNVPRGTRFTIELPC